jgi:putative oxidoreductase
MALPRIVPRLARRTLLVLGALAFIAPLATRLLIGQAFVLTGRGKLANPSNVVEFFTGLGIPMPELNAAFVSNLEFWGGWALILGLGTRLFAAGLASTMVVAMLTADKATAVGALSDFVPALLGRSTSEAPGPTDVTPLVYLSFLVWLLLTGPGPVSLDRVIWKLTGLDKPEEPPAATSK